MSRFSPKRFVPVDGDAVKALRIAQGYSQLGLSIESRVSVNTIKRIEANGRARAMKSTLLLLAGALSVPTTALTVFDPDNGLIPEGKGK